VTQPSEPAGSRRPRLTRRSTSVAVLATGAGITLLGAGQPWVRLDLDTALTATGITVTGSALAPLSVAAAAVGLAGVLAVLSARTWGRRVVGAVVAIVGGAALVQVLTLAGDLAARARDWWSVDVGSAAAEATAATTVWPAVTAAGLALLVAGGVLVLVAGRGWGGLSPRYEAPTGAAAAAPDSGDLWQALDRGEDPTSGDDPRSGDPAPDDPARDDSAG
jgi:uncharacterized membrane protein (TIGR02234 family)